MNRKFESLAREDQVLLLNGLPLLSRIFWGPDPELCAALLDPGFQQEHRRFGCLLGKDAESAAAAMLRFLEPFSETGELCGRLEESYVRLFVNAPGGVCAPLYQSCYEGEGGLLMGSSAIRMRSRLEAAGITADPAEPPDHLAVEVEYLFLLLESALERQDADPLHQVRHFAGEELLPWLTRFCGRLAGEERCPFYPAAARLLRAAALFIAAEIHLD